jgi:hypothetical protein
MQPEHAIHRPNFRGLDQLGMGDRHGMQDALKGFLPKLQKPLQFREVGTNIIGLQKENSGGRRVRRSKRACSRRLLLISAQLKRTLVTFGD